MLLLLALHEFTRLDLIRAETDTATKETTSVNPLVQELFS